jgi:RNA polymerase sigma-70 factor (ECF subfamily)
MMEGESPQRRGRYRSCVYSAVRSRIPGILPVTEADKLRPPADGGDEQVQQSDAGALWHRFHRRLVILGMRRLGSRADAEDIAQEALQRVTKALGENRLRDADALPGFVFQTARHVCQQILRKRGREHRALEGIGNDAEEPSSTAQPLTDLIDEERRVVVRQALRSLASEDRQLVEQLYVLDVDPQELAQRLGITPGALRVRKHRILKRLSAALSNDVTD